MDGHHVESVDQDDRVHVDDAGHNLHVRSDQIVETVCGGDHPAGADEGAAAELRVRCRGHVGEEERHRVGLLPCRNHGSTDDQGAPAGRQARDPEVRTGPVEPLGLRAESTRRSHDRPLVVKVDHRVGVDVVVDRRLPSEQHLPVTDGRRQPGRIGGRRHRHRRHGCHGRPRARSHRVPGPHTGVVRGAVRQSLDRV